MFNAYKPINNKIKLDEILQPRFPPFIWDLFGYIGGFIAVVYYNQIWLIFYSCILFVYSSANTFFEFCTVSFDYLHDDLPKYDELSMFEMVYITNKKYQLKKILGTRYDKDGLKDVSNLILELNIYMGESDFIRNLLDWIYYIGFTRKNYTMENSDKLKNNCIYTV
jgi:hypothetical protein